MITLFRDFPIRRRFYHIRRENDSLDGSASGGQIAS
jgi:hypothetical protein